MVRLHICTLTVSGCTTDHFRVFQIQVAAPQHHSLHWLADWGPCSHLLKAKNMTGFPRRFFTDQLTWTIQEVTPHVWAVALISSIVFQRFFFKQTEPQLIWTAVIALYTSIMNHPMIRFKVTVNCVSTHYLKCSFSEAGLKNVNHFRNENWAEITSRSPLTPAHGIIKDSVKSRKRNQHQSHYL